MARTVPADNVNWYKPLATYPVDQWFNGAVWKLTPGEDFTAPIPAFRAHLRHAANRLGLTIRTRVRDGHLYVQALPLEG